MRRPVSAEPASAPGVVRSIVGAYKPPARPRHPLFRDPSKTLCDSQPFYVAASGVSLRQRGTVALLDGYLFEPDLLAAALGVPLESEEDLIVAAYKQWGVGMLDHLDGEFVLVLWDHEARNGLIARDRCGVRPLFILPRGGTLYFASELAELRQLFPHVLPPDERAIARALGGWFLHDDRTVYEGVKRLPPASLAELSGDSYRFARYWEPRFSGTASLTRTEAVEEVKNRIALAITRRVRTADQPGVLLSGGLDSMSIAAIGADALRPRGKTLRTYSARFPAAPSADESADLEAAADDLDGPALHMTVSGGSPLAGALDFLQEWEVPLGPPSHFVWQPLLRRAVAEGVNVMLEGNGGDEVFAAAPHLVGDRIRRLHLLSAICLAKQMPGRVGPGRRALVSALLAFGFSDVFPTLGRRREAESVSPLLTSAAKRLFEESAAREHWRDRDGPRWWAYRVDEIYRRPHALGFWDYERRAAASAGSVCRQPLHDIDLVEFISSLPPEWSFDKSLSRPLLREAGLGLVPDHIRLKRRKATFNPVFLDPLINTDLPLIREIVGTSDGEIYRYADRDIVARHLLPGPAAHPRGPHVWALEIWRLVNVELWLRSLRNPSAIPALSEIAARQGEGAHTFLRP